MESEILNEFRKWIFIMFMNAQVAYDNMRCGGANRILLYTKKMRMMTTTTI